MIPERVLQPFTEAAFGAGLLAGVAGLLAGGVAALVWRIRHRGALPVAGLAMAGAAVAALAGLNRLPEELALAVAALATAGVLADLLPPLRRFLPLLAAPGAWILAGGTAATQSWVPLALGLTVALGGPAAASLDRHWRDRAIGPAMVAVSFAGVFVTVPETREALPVLGAVLPVALLGWPANLASVGAGGALAATGVLAWTVATGGTFRDSAVVGGLACLGVLVAEPVGRTMAGAFRQGKRGGQRHGSAARTGGLAAVVGVLALHVVVVLFVARVAGRSQDLQPAVVLAVAALVIAAGATVAGTLAGQARPGRSAAGARTRAGAHR